MPRAKAIRVLALAPLLAAMGPAAVAADPGERPRHLQARGVLCVSVAGQFLVEAWDYNVSRETLSGLGFGLAYGLTDRLSGFVDAEASHIAERETAGAVLIAVPLGIRWDLMETAAGAIQLEAAIGASYANRAVPTGGTRFNYILRTAVNLSRPLSRDLNLVSGLRWVHLSNYSLAGRHRNPDLQMVGVHVGVMVVTRRR